MTWSILIKKKKTRYKDLEKSFSVSGRTMDDGHEYNGNILGLQKIYF